MTYRSGNTEQLQKIYIRGSQVRFMILPDMLKNAPMLNQTKQDHSRRGLGRGGFGQSGGRGRGGPPGRGGFGRGGNDRTHSANQGVTAGYNRPGGRQY